MISLNMANKQDFPSFNGYDFRLSLFIPSAGDRGSISRGKYLFTFASLPSFTDTKVNTQATRDLPVCARHVVHPVYHQ